MSHLDEGQLHAYLDGERRDLETHLTACAECRGRLEEARRFRDRAQAILRAGSPGVISAPPFEELGRRKARATKRRAPRTLVLAWAATVALAVGVGWYARSLALREPASQLEVAARPITARAPAPEPPQTAPTRTRADRQPPAERATAPVEPVRQLEERVAVAPGAGAVSDSLREANTRLNTRDLSRAMAQRAPAAANPIPAAAAAEPVAATDEREWIPVSRGEAERLLDDQLAALPDLETLGITVRAAAGVREARTVQRLPDGRTIELIQLRLDTQPRTEARLRSAAEAASATVAIEWSNSRVTGRGALPADSLRALLQQLRRARP